MVDIQMYKNYKYPELVKQLINKLEHSDEVIHNFNFVVHILPSFKILINRDVEPLHDNDIMVIKLNVAYDFTDEKFSGGDYYIIIECTLDGDYIVAKGDKATVLKQLNEREDIDFLRDVVEVLDEYLNR